MIKRKVKEVPLSVIEFNLLCDSITEFESLHVVEHVAVGQVEYFITEQLIVLQHGWVVGSKSENVDHVVYKELH
jgi:hypothetical protein